MDFWSAYAHGFARVAACTVPVAIADPARNAAIVLEQARACHEDGGRARGVPRALAVRLLDRRPAAAGHPARRGARGDRHDRGGLGVDLLPVIVVGAPLVHGTRVVNCAVVIHRGRILGVAPKSYLPTYREFYERRWFAPGDDRRGATITPRRRRGAVRPRPDLHAPPTCRASRLHVEICEDMWVPVPPSAEASLAGATVLANLSGSPITVARAEDRRLLVRSASARCNAAYLYAAAGQGESTTDLSWDGQTMVYECGDLLAESERFPDGPRRAVADVDLDRIRQERLRQGTHDDNRRTLGGPGRGVPHRRVRARPRRPATSGCAARSTGSRSCPTTPSGWPWTATRPTTSRSPGSSSGCTRSASPRWSSASAAASTRPTR